MSLIIGGAVAAGVLGASAVGGAVSWLVALSIREQTLVRWGKSAAEKVTKEVTGTVAKNLDENHQNRLAVLVAAGKQELVALIDPKLAAVDAKLVEVDAKLVEVDARLGDVGELVQNGNVLFSAVRQERQDLLATIKKAIEDAKMVTGVADRAQSWEARMDAKLGQLAEQEERYGVMKDRADKVVATVTTAVDDMKKVQRTVEAHDRAHQTLMSNLTAKVLTVGEVQTQAGEAVRDANMAAANLVQTQEKLDGMVAEVKQTNAEVTGMASAVGQAMSQVEKLLASLVQVPAARPAPANGSNGAKKGTKKAREEAAKKAQEEAEKKAREEADATVVPNLGSGGNEGEAQDAKAVPVDTSAAA